MEFVKKIEDNFVIKINILVMAKSRLHNNILPDNYEDVTII